MDDNLKALIDYYNSCEFRRGAQTARIEMLIEIVFNNARKIGQHERRYGYELDDVKVDGSTILALFNERYPKEILDLFKDKPEEGDAVGTD